MTKHPESGLQQNAIAEKTVNASDETVTLRRAFAFYKYPTRLEPGALRRRRRALEAHGS